MLVPFSSISNESKLFIFPSSRKFYQQELSELNISIEQFLISYCENKNDFSCSFTIKYDRFLLIAINTGSSSLKIEDHDTLILFIQKLEVKYNVILLDKINVCFKQGEFVQYKEMKDFKKLIKDKSVSSKTIVFDNLINTKGDLEENWELPITESWLGRYL